MSEKKDKWLVDGKGRILGHEIGNVTLDSKGHIAARYVPSSNRTVDREGRIKSVGDLRIRELGGSKE